MFDFNKYGVALQDLGRDSQVFSNEERAGVEYNITVAHF
jgi:hypothetical protein